MANKRIWITYNHVPGGQIVAMHFETVTRERKTGDSTTEKKVITPEEQVRGWEKSDCVALNVKGQIVKNKILTYAGPELDDDDLHAADRVIAWAQQMGLEPIYTPKEKTAVAQAAPEQTRRIDNLETRIGSIEQKQDESDKKIDKILDAVTAKK